MPLFLSHTWHLLIFICSHSFECTRFLIWWKIYYLLYYLGSCYNLVVIIVWTMCDVLWEDNMVWFFMIKTSRFFELHFNDYHQYVYISMIDSIFIRYAFLLSFIDSHLVKEPSKHNFIAWNPPPQFWCIIAFDA